MPTLFDLPEPPSLDCVRNGPCKTCGAVRPDDYARHMFLEPVSHECGDCNSKTIGDFMDAIRRRDPVRARAVYARHYGPTPRHAAKINRTKGN